MADFNSILEQLEPWSLFELNRLYSAIATILDDPKRNEAIRCHLSVGMQITYFCCDKNCLVDATIVKIKKTRVNVINTHDNKRWNISFYLINLEGIDTTITPKKYSGGLDRNSLKVGDHVGWHSKLGRDFYGIVEKLNPKKALIRLGNGDQWTVSYSLLFLVMDGTADSEKNGPLCIEGEVIR